MIINSAKAGVLLAPPALLIKGVQTAKTHIFNSERILKTMAILLDYENELALLGRWITNQNRDDIAIFNKGIFINCPKLYKGIAAGLSWAQIPENAKAEIISDTPQTELLKLGADSFIYNQARYSALIAQRSFLADKLNGATDEERQRLYYDIDEISDLISGKEKQPIDKSSANTFLDSFINGGALSEMPFISTQFNSFDKALDGGLYPGLYVLGAISSMGKTSIMLQIADQIAAQGISVLYFTLEMGAHELIAKSISRYSYIEAGRTDQDAATAKSITNMHKRALFNSRQAENVDKAIESYKSNIANNLWFFESLGDIGTKEIRREVEKHRKTTGKTPIVFIDYLQILKPYNEFWTEKRNTDKAITELRKLSRDYKTPVFCISSLNRDSYKGDIDLSAFKESGGVEYGSDVLLGLQPPDLEAGLTPKEAKANKKTIEEEKRKVVRDLEIKILKNRSGATGERIPFTYNAKFNYFEENAGGYDNIGFSTYTAYNPFE